MMMNHIFRQLLNICLDEGKHFLYILSASAFLCHCFSTFLYLFHYTGRTFPLYLETKILASEAHILSTFPASFQHFTLKFGEDVAR